MGIAERIAALVEPLKAEERELLKEEKELQSQLADVRADLKRVQQMLRYADPESYQKEEKEATGPSEATINKIFRIMWSEPAKTWSIAELAKRTSLHSTSISAVIQVLRQRGEVRNMGRLPRRPGQMGLTSLGFKVAEAATPPNGHEPAPKKELRRMVSPEKVEQVWEMIQEDPGREWTRKEIIERVPWHKTQVDFAFRILVEDGQLEETSKAKGKEPAHYKVVTSGAS